MCCIILNKWNISYEGGLSNSDKLAVYFALHPFQSVPRPLVSPFQNQLNLPFPIKKTPLKTNTHQCFLCHMKKSYFLSLLAPKSMLADGFLVTMEWPCVRTSWDSSGCGRPAQSAHSEPRVASFMAVIVGRIRDCSASSISEPH